jgi:hypothetical protein
MKKLFSVIEGEPTKKNPRRMRFCIKENKTGVVYFGYSNKEKAMRECRQLNDVYEKYPEVKP